MLLDGYSDPNDVVIQHHHDLCYSDLGTTSEPRTARIVALRLRKAKPEMVSHTLPDMTWNDWSWKTAPPARAA